MKSHKGTIALALAAALTVPLLLFAILTQVPTPGSLSDPPALRAQELRVDVTFHRTLLGTYSILVDHVKGSPMRIVSWDRIKPDWHPFDFCIVACTSAHTATVSLQSDAGQSMSAVHHVNSFSLAGGDRRTSFVFSDAHPGDYQLSITLDTTDGERHATLTTTFQIIPG